MELEAREEISIGQTGHESWVVLADPGATGSICHRAALAHGQTGEAAKQ